MTPRSLRPIRPEGPDGWRAAGAPLTGATLRELMDRMGHGTTRAALIYQHGSAERDRLIADAVSKLTAAQRAQSKSSSGTQRQQGFITMTAKLVIMPKSWAFAVERVTRIELALSAWEAQRLGLPGALTRRSWQP